MNVTITQDLMKQIRTDIDKQIFVIDTGWYGNDCKRVGLQDWVNDLVVKLLEDHKTEIIERASEKLADKMSRTKAFKEAMAEKILEES